MRLEGMLRGLLFLFFIFYFPVFSDSYRINYENEEELGKIYALNRRRILIINLERSRKIRKPRNRQDTNIVRNLKESLCKDLKCINSDRVKNA
jgi:hypothetical protein